MCTADHAKTPFTVPRGTFSIFSLMLVNFTNFLGIACIFLQHINHCLGRFVPVGGSRLIPHLTDLSPGGIHE